MDATLSTGESLLSRAFAGRVALWRIFWLAFVPAPLVLWAIYLGILWGWATLTPMTDIRAIVVPFSLVVLVLTGTVGLCVWRCSKNSRSRIWGVLARLTVVAYLLWYGSRALSILLAAVA
jgi:hypothetical protein